MNIVPNGTSFGLVVALSLGCANLSGGAVEERDGGRPDVLPGLNADGADPFRPVDASLFVDGGVDTGLWQLPDTGTVFDQRYAFLWVGAYMTMDVEGAYASAEFRLVPRLEDPRCTYLSAGSWDEIRCHEVGAPPTDPHPLPFPNAGQVSIEGGTQGVGLLPMPNGSYAYFYEQSPVFRGPREVRIRARGTSMVPPFTLTATIPAPIVVTEPRFESGALWEVPRERDVTVAWRTLDARSVYASLTATGTLDGVRGSVRVIAEFPGAAGRGVIPARALRGLFEVGAATVTVTITPQNLSTQRVGPWPVQLTASGRAVNVIATLR
jgi:hypothetical protein